MNYDQRKDEALRLVVKFLDDFVTPRGLSEDALTNRINFIADSFARKMPTKGDYTELVEAVLLKIRDTHESNTWPAQAAFVMAMPAGERPGFSTPQTYAPDQRERYSRLMNEGEAVPEGIIWGGIGASLDVPRGTMEAYRNASVRSWMDVYKHDALDLMVGKYGDVVRMYFPVREAAE